MATPRSGKLAKIRIESGAIVVVAGKWTVDDSCEELDTTSFESAGYTDRIAGPLSAEFHIEGYMDGALNPYDTSTSPDLDSGNTHATVKLFLNDTTGPFWSFPSCLITNTQTSAEVKGLINFSCTGKNKGTFSPPTGTF